MANFDLLKELIRSGIYENEDQEITGEVMQNTLLEMVRSLGTGYKYIGIADATTDPGTPDENVFYFATTAGTYTNFGNLTVAANEIAILKGSGSSWSKDVTSIASTGALQALNAALEQLGQQIAPASLTYAELKTLRDAGELIPGKIYRITDYVTTTIDPESRSAGHVFDLLVIAIDASHLSEDAGACLHDGDTYFANTNFSAWKIRYCLDNDTTRFTWADATDGKGVIYRMMDEWLNVAPYDFKNIQFKRYKVTAKADYTEVLSIVNGLYLGLPDTNSKGLDIDTSDYKWFYTFTKLGATWADDVVDDSITGIGTGTTTIDKPTYSGAYYLNNIVMANGDPMAEFFNSQEDKNYISVNCHFGINAHRLTLFGMQSQIFADSQFRNNIIVAAHRHSHYATNCQNNTIVITRDFAFNKFGDEFRDNIICANNDGYNNVFNQNITNNVLKINSQVRWGANNFGSFFAFNTLTLTDLSRMNFGLYFYHNTGYGNFFDSTTLSTVDESTFGTSESPVSLRRSCIGPYFHSNKLTGELGNSKIFGQVQNCELNGPIQGCTFDAFLEYIIIAAGSNSSRFAAIDVKGNIRGTNAAKISLNAPAFRLSALSGISRRVTIEGDSDGAIVATWRGANGQQTGIRSSDKGATWAALT